MGVVPEKTIALSLLNETRKRKNDKIIPKDLFLFENVFKF